MKKFEFSNVEPSTSPAFSGNLFYNMYKDAKFLRDSKNIEKILSRGYELRKTLKDIAPGEKVIVEGVWLKDNTPLVVRKAGPNVSVGNYEFTANRLSGFVAAYVFNNRHQFPAMKSSEALILGLTWSNTNANKSRLYLSAVSGAEHFYDEFLFWPLICALRKLQLKKITLEPVIKMANIKNKAGIRMGQELTKNFDVFIVLWRHFPEATDKELKTFIVQLPAELKNLLKKP